MKKQTIKLALFVFVLAILAYGVYMAYTDIMRPKKERFTSSEGTKVKICLYKATWCHHCVAFVKSNVFEDVYSDVKGKYDDVVFATYDFDENKKMAEQYNINSFPTIIAVDANGKLLDTFDGDRNNKGDLMRFVEVNRQKV
jgi:thiol-disulfide isomerase/thioredoxin